jgi:DNA helicase-2/ATP-dependent DNA helicase PcrA
MVGMEEGVLPHSRARADANQLEEERRLCFVGITRAQQRLIFSRAFARTLMGRRERTVASPFLSEMSANHIETIDRSGFDFKYDADIEPANTGDFSRGQSVRHATFGLGRIIEIHHMGRHTRAIVDFQRAGKKTLILEYAQLEPA